MYYTWQCVFFRINNKLYEEKHNKSNNRQAWSANPRLRQHTEKEAVQNNNVNNVTIETGKTALTQNKSTLRRRPCSAKARLESSSKPSKHHASTPDRNDTDTTLDSTLSNTCMMLVPINGKEVPVVDIGGDALYHVASLHVQCHIKLGMNSVHVHVVL
jgi:hypothetical protein